MDHAFFTVTDRSFFPGTLSTINSILRFHPKSPIYVINNKKQSLNSAQLALLKKSAQITVLSSSEFEENGHINAWELKSYGAAWLADLYDVIVGIDSDCILCGPVMDKIQQAYAAGGFLGGKDGNGSNYGKDYKIYGIETPAYNAKYMSTSLFFCAATPDNKKILSKWAAACSKAVFNEQGSYPGHGDQGVLNAVLFAANKSENVELLPNEIWSQHWVYWSSDIDFQDGKFINWTYEGGFQRSFHCGGAEKFWVSEHRDKVLGEHSLQTYPYVWFLALLWFGPCRDWSVDPFSYLPDASRHLIRDLFNFLPQILTLHPEAQELCEEMNLAVLDRAIEGIPRALSTGSSMDELIALLAAEKGARRYVEIGGLNGGSLLTIALRFAHQDMECYSVESFMGNHDGTMDGRPLPSRRQFLENLRQFPSARARLVAGDSGLAHASFDDETIDFLFIDGCHDTPAVLKDIDLWRPKMRQGGIMAGDDFGWESVKQAVNERFPHANSTPSGYLWWIRV